LKDVTQYFKDYTIDEVVIFMPQANRLDEAKENPSMDGVYDIQSSARMIYLAPECETNKTVNIGKHSHKGRK